MKVEIKSGANLSGMDLSRAILYKADLSNANLEYANLRDADLRFVDFRGANLRHADLSGAVMRGADLRGAKLDNTNFSGADLFDADLCDGSTLIRMGPLGSREDYLVCYVASNGLLVETGLFFGTIDDFAKSVPKMYGEGERGRIYNEAIKFLKSYGRIKTTD